MVVSSYYRKLIYFFFLVAVVVVVVVVELVTAGVVVELVAAEAPLVPPEEFQATLAPVAKIDSDNLLPGMVVMVPSPLTGFPFFPRLTGVNVLSVPAPPLIGLELPWLKVKSPL